MPISKWKVYEASSRIETVEYQQFESFCLRANQLRKNWIDFLGSRKTLAMSFDRSSGKIEENALLQNPHRLKGLFLDFRVFIARNETTEYKKICNKLTQRFTESHVREFLEYEKSVWDQESALQSWHYFSSNEIIDTYFNGRLFHTDRSKHEKLLTVLRNMTEPALNAVILLEIDKKSRIINNLNLCCEYLQKHEPKIKVPIANFAANKII
ncbi:hypothetical protein [Antarctobacter sp.]|uniref:hypothetical protein n=1 Tax=Antarctobacter sp. TaxID=1872577 RepID=UPI002B27BF4D|nr:hypothetical protein [Antarctobacter sp.]